MRDTFDGGRGPAPRARVKGRYQLLIDTGLSDHRNELGRG